MKKKLDKEYYLTRGEYAEKINKSKGSVIQSMRRGGLTNEYIIRDNCYYFRDPSKKRENKVSVYGPIYTPKKTYNRGNHLKANYPNHAFQQHNELKMLAALQRKVDPKKAAKIPRAIELIEQQDREQKQKSILQKPTKNYGGMMSRSELNREKFNPTNRGRINIKKTYY